MLDDTQRYIFNMWMRNETAAVIHLPEPALLG